MYLGLPSDRLLDDLSPDGLAEQAELVRRTLPRAGEQPIDTDGEQVAADVLDERLQLHLDRYEAGDFHSALNVIASPVQDVRMLFDLLPKDSDDDYADIAARMRALPEAFAGYAESLREGVRRGRVAAIRQVDKCAEQCDTYSGTSGGEPGTSRRSPRRASAPARLPRSWPAAAQVADAAYADLATFLRTELRQHAPEQGRRRAARCTPWRPATSSAPLSTSRRRITGDGRSSSAWRPSCKECVRAHPPGGGTAGGRRPARQRRPLSGHRHRRAATVDAAAVRRRRRRARAGPTSTSPSRSARSTARSPRPAATVGAYYTGPSDDLSRPGAMWWSVEAGREVFSTWRETTVVYHEGVPGHHLQIATAVYQRDSLNDFQRLLAGTSGHAEGWALYAERLMRELGYLDDDPILLGMLDAQLFRAARVVVDIGMHLELEIPGGTGFHEGERWTPELGLEFLLTRTVSEPKHSADEIDRYLGWPGQAPSYKVGERVWIDGRDAARARHGDDFDPKAFHTKALQFGGMGLDPLAALLATI